MFYFLEYNFRFLEILTLRFIECLIRSALCHIEAKSFVNCPILSLGARPKLSKPIGLRILLTQYLTDFSLSRYDSRSWGTMHKLRLVCGYLKKMLDPFGIPHIETSSLELSPTKQAVPERTPGITIITSAQCECLLELENRWLVHLKYHRFWHCQSFKMKK